MMTFIPAREQPREPCDGYVSLLVRAADETLDVDGRARLEAHLPGCDACRAALDTQQTARVMLAGAFDEEPPLGFSTRVVAHVDVQDRWLDRLDFRRWTWRIGPVAAALALAAWVVAAGSAATSASVPIDLVSASDAGVDADAVRWSDVVNGADIVSLAWDAEVGTTAVTPEEAPQ